MDVYRIFAYMLNFICLTVQYMLSFTFTDFVILVLRTYLCNCYQIKQYLYSILKLFIVQCYPLILIFKSEAIIRVGPFVRKS